MNRTWKISSVLIVLWLVVVAAGAARAAPASKPKEIVVVGSKLMAARAQRFVREAERMLATWGPRIEGLRAMGRDDLADEAVRRVSERLRHKARAATADVGRIERRSLKLLAMHGGDETDVRAIQDAADAAERLIGETVQRIIGILVGL